HPADLAEEVLAVPLLGRLTALPAGFRAGHLPGIHHADHLLTSGCPVHFSLKPPQPVRTRPAGLNPFAGHVSSDQALTVPARRPMLVTGAPVAAVPGGGGSVTVQELLRHLIERAGSDLHLKVGAVPYVRID